MLKRISRDELLLNIAKLVAKRSTCQRASVGAILAREGRIISMGYNGAPAGLPHCRHKVEDSRLLHVDDDIDHVVEGCTRTVHAEANAIAFAAKSGVETNLVDLYTTHSPCNDCAKLIINAGIARVVYIEEYRDKKPLDLLQLAGVGVLAWPV